MSKLEVMVSSLSLGDRKFCLDNLLPALSWLDQLLEQAIAAAQINYGLEAAADPYRGLHISKEEVERILAGKPDELAFRVEEKPEEFFVNWVEHSSGLAWLRRIFELSAFDIKLMVIAIAPEINLRYEQLYAYLQNHVARKRPSVDLALNLLCSSVEDKLVRCAHFAADAPLIRHGILHLFVDPNQVQPPLVAHAFKLDEQIVRLLLGQKGLERQLASFCRIVEPSVGLDELPLSQEQQQGLRSLILQTGPTDQPLRLYFSGSQGTGKRRVAEALAKEVGAPLLVADLTRALATNTDFERLLQLLFREAWFQDAILYLEGLDTLRRDDRSVEYQSLLERLTEDRGMTILAGVQPWTASGAGSGAIAVPFPPLDMAQRRVCWQANLDAVGIVLNNADLDALAGRFRLTQEQIAAAVTTAHNQLRWQSAAQSIDELGGQLSHQPAVQALFAAARAHSSHDLATLARKIEPLYTWDDLVLPTDVQTQLRELCQRVIHRDRVLGQWGFHRKLSLGRGVNALFAGPSGTGKTMATEVIANALGLDLYKIDLSGVVSKYIGETEKNLNQIFAAAENANSILLFDEADALFGKRSEVRDSHDRYANLEVSYLLQKMEEYEGVAILSTNLRQNLDESFLRRLTFTIHFPFPEEADRCRIWASVFPRETPLGEDVNLEFLAQQFKLSGGNIKNIALSAAFLAAEDGDCVTMAHLLQATQREYQKLGKVLSEAELRGGLGEA